MNCRLTIACLPVGRAGLTVVIMMALALALPALAQEGAERVIEDRDTVTTTFDSVNVRAVDRDPYLLQVFHDGATTDTIFVALENDTTDTTGVTLLMLLAADPPLELWLKASVNYNPDEEEHGERIQLLAENQGTLKRMD